MGKKSRRWGNKSVEGGERRLKKVRKEKYRSWGNKIKEGGKEEQKTWKEE